MTPSQWLKAVQNGDLPLSEADSSVRSMFELQLFLITMNILNKPKSERLAEIEKHPDTYKEELKAYVSKTYNQIKSQGGIDSDGDLIDPKLCKRYG